jgi:hypothetical protein
MLLLKLFFAGTSLRDLSAMVFPAGGNVRPSTGRYTYYDVFRARCV